MSRRESRHIDSIQRVPTGCLCFTREFSKEGAFSSTALCLTSSAKNVGAKWIPLCPTLATP